MVVAGLGLAVSLACGCRTPPGQVAAAGITTGSALALAAANRAVTNDCWASCDHGYVCDRERGVCVLPSELKVPSRPMGDPDDWDDGCIEEEDGTRLCPEDAVPAPGAAARPVDGSAAHEPPAADGQPSCDGGADCPAADAGLAGAAVTCSGPSCSE
jgi:hypothetical protein